MTARPTIDQLLAVEHVGWRSLCDSTGGSFYTELMTPDAVMILVNGMMIGRDDVAQSLGGAPPWSTYELTDARLVPISDTAAALVYRARAHRGDPATAFEALMTSVYTLVEGQPRLSLYQQTAVSN